MIDFNKTWIEINCPKCGYGVNVQFIDVKTEKAVFCHNCKISIKLIDSNASTYTSVNNLNKAMSDLENTLKNL